MERNVGPAERYVRMAVGLAAGAAATRTTGWKRAALAVVATSGLGTAAAGYCPLNQLAGRDTVHEKWPLDPGLYDTTGRRNAAVSSAFGSTPSEAPVDTR